MKVVWSWNDWSNGDQSACHLAIGAFDGLHIGHQALFQKVKDRATHHGGEAWVLTFAPHPSRVLAPDTAPLLLTSIDHKLNLMEPMGLDGCIMHPFTRELSQLQPEPFFDTLCAAIPNLRTIVVGPNWRFGHKAKGTTELLKELAAQYQIDVIIQEPVLLDGEPVSSTRIRLAVEAGRLAEATQMLDRTYSLYGTVRSGKQLGRELGFPTANIHLQDEARPPTGVYAVQALFNGECHNGAAYLGLRPTAQGRETAHILEVHIFDAQLDLYDKAIEVRFMQHIRGDQRFPDHHALKTQIARDVARARIILQAHL